MRKIAAFDLVGHHSVEACLDETSLTYMAIKTQDSTLIQTSSGNVFAKDPTDWRWWHPSIPNVLKQLHADGYVTSKDIMSPYFSGVVDSH